MLNLATKFRPGRLEFEQAYAAGFRCAELYLSAEILEQVDDILAMAQQFDMRYAMHFPNKPVLGDQHLEAIARLFDGLSASAIVIHPPMLKRYQQAMRTIHSDIVLAEETMRVPLETFQEWVSDREAVTLDIEHVWKFTLHDAPMNELFRLIRSVFDRSADHIRHIHMPGYLPGQGEHRPMYTSREFCLGVFDILADFNFTGLVVAEVDMPFQNPHDLQMDRLLYERWQQLRNASSQTK